MAIAITLPLDDRAAGKIVDLWQTLAAEGVGRDTLDLGYKPHVTLAITDADPPGGTLPPALRELAPIPISLPGLGVFVGTPSCCYVSVAPSPTLLTAHRLALAGSVQLGLDPHHRPGAWMPHVTLTATLADAVQVSRAVAVLHARFGAFTATLDRVELVRFPPLEILASVALG